MSSKNKTAVSSSKRAKIGVYSAFIGIICNFILFAAKLAVGLLFGAISITADAINNLSDASSSVVTLIGFKVSQKPADKEHPYGHGRSEYISGMVVAAMILFIGFELVKSSFGKIIDPQPVRFSIITVIVLIFSIIVKLFMSIYNLRAGRRINSKTLIATSRDSLNDVITTTAVLLAAIIEGFFRLPADGYFGLAVSLFIIYSGIVLVKDTINPLIGLAGSRELREAITNIVCKYDMVIGYHDLLVHDYGPGNCFASIHVEMDRDNDPMFCHEIIDSIERECHDALNTNLVIHYDPIVTDNKELASLKALVKNILVSYDSGLDIHDFRIAPGNKRTKLIFDVHLPDSLYKKRNEIEEYLSSRLYDTAGEKYFAVITFDPPSQN